MCMKKFSASPTPLIWRVLISSGGGVLRDDGYIFKIVLSLLQLSLGNSFSHRRNITAKFFGKTFVIIFIVCNYDFRTILRGFVRALKFFAMLWGGGEAIRKNFMILGVFRLIFYQKYRLLLTKKIFSKYHYIASFSQNRDTQWLFQNQKTGGTIILHPG